MKTAARVVAIVLVGAGAVEVRADSISAGTVWSSGRTENRVVVEREEGPITTMAAFGWDSRDEQPRGTVTAAWRGGRAAVGGIRLISLAGWRSDGDVDPYSLARHGPATRPTLRRDVDEGTWLSYRLGSVTVAAGRAGGDGSPVGQVALDRHRWRAEWIHGPRDNLIAIRLGGTQRALTLGLRHAGAPAWRLAFRYRVRAGRTPISVSATRMIVSSSSRDAAFSRGRTGSALRIRAGPVEMGHAWAVGVTDTSRGSHVRLRGRVGRARLEFRVAKGRTQRGTVRVDANLDGGWSVGGTLGVVSSGQGRSWHPVIRLARRIARGIGVTASVHRSAGGGGWGAFGGGPRRVERMWVGDGATLVACRLSTPLLEVVVAERTGPTPEVRASLWMKR